jgi:hypothetical protein
MRNGATAILLVIAIVAGAGAGYLAGASNQQPTTTTITTTGTLPFQIVNPNVTVRGQAAGLPCAALRLPCPYPVNQSIDAVLIRYNGTYYYLSYYGLTNATNPTQRVTTWYTIWYDNSTAFCVSPKVEWSITCPA